MTLYYRREGKFVPFTADQIKRFKRSDEVSRLRHDADKLQRTTKALAVWLGSVQYKALQLDARDLMVTRLPNIDRIMAVCDDVQHALQALEKM